MSERQPATAKPSATIVVARDGVTTPEVLMVRRRAGDAFGDSYAFPGGVIDHDESNAHIACQGRSAEEADTTLGIANGLDYYSAAIRELFEETGILLARDTGGEWTSYRNEFGALRIAVDKGDLPWPEFLREQGLCMAADALHYIAYWETPRARPKRWQTRFFVAELPPGQVAIHDGSEVTDSSWLTPADALAMAQKGDIVLPFPTTRTLQDLAAFATLEALIDWARNRSAEGIGKIRPALTKDAGNIRILAPGEPGYEEADRLWHTI